MLACISYFIAYYLWHMYRLLVFIALMLHTLSSYAQTIVNPHGMEHTGKTPEYDAVVEFYNSLAAKYPTIQVHSAGPTDTDDSLLVVYYSEDANFNIARWKKQGKLIVFINNGIHPGEPDGIIASMQLLWDITQEKIRFRCQTTARVYQ